MSVNGGATGLMLRKAREFASKSVVPFMLRRVIPRGAGVAFKKSDSLFEYPNQSILYWGGMKDDMQREALRSIGQDGALDFVWIEEANAFTIDDFEEILARMRGKAGGYTQIVLTTNPDGPNHWINQRLILGQQASVYYSSAVDNPYNPPEYQAKLDQLTGVRRLRLRDGKWVQAEGVIYDNFDPRPGYNVDEAAEYTPGRTIIWGIDDGYVQGDGPGHANYHPRVCLFGQVTPIGGLNIFAEYYRTGEPSYDVTINALLNQENYPYAPPDAIYVDSSAQMFIGALWTRDLFAMGGTHKVSEGIKNVRRLISDEHGMRLLRIHPRCVNLIREMSSYVYDSASSVAQIGEPKPLSIDDHGPSALRYMAFPLRNVTEA